MSKFDEPPDLLERKRGKSLVKFVDALPHIEAIHNGVWQDARTAHYGPSRNLAGDLFDQFALHPVDVLNGVCHMRCPSIPILADRGPPRHCFVNTQGLKRPVRRAALGMNLDGSGENRLAHRSQTLILAQGFEE